MSCSQCSTVTAGSGNADDAKHLEEGFIHFICEFRGGQEGSCRQVLEEKELRCCYVMCVCLQTASLSLFWQTLQDEKICGMKGFTPYSLQSGRRNKCPSIGSQYAAHAGKSAYLTVFSLVCIQVNMEWLLPTCRQKVCVQKSDMSAGVISETDQCKKTQL